MPSRTSVPAWLRRFASDFANAVQTSRWLRTATADHRCINCGEPFNIEGVGGDRRPVGVDGSMGCDWGEWPHPCGGVYRVTDYHRAA